MAVSSAQGSESILQQSKLQSLLLHNCECSKTFLFLSSNKMWVTTTRAEIHKMLFRTANRVDPDQTADLCLPCLFCKRPFWQATSVRNFRIFTVFSDQILQSNCKIVLDKRNLFPLEEKCSEFLFVPKETYCGTQWNHHDETLPMSTNYIMFSWSSWM